MSATVGNAGEPERFWSLDLIVRLLLMVGRF
jgi:hypothetical protein